VSLVASGKIAPPELVEALIQSEPRQLSEEPFGALTLIVRAPDDDDGAFMRALVERVLQDVSGNEDLQGWLSTSEFPTVSMGDVEPSDEDYIELLAELASAPHCIVPLRNRGHSLTIGRSPDSQIFLHDPSVSGSHAIIDQDKGGVVMKDQASKNGTFVNGQRLSPGEERWLQPMDRLSFGRIQAFSCDPRALRGVLRQDLRTLL
jgi:hypothetical protein